MKEDMFINILIQQNNIFIKKLFKKIIYLLFNSIVSVMVSYSPSKRVTGVRFPDDAIVKNI